MNKHPGAVLMEAVRECAEERDTAPIPEDMSSSFQIYDFDWPKGDVLSMPIEEYRELLKRGYWFTMRYQTLQMIRAKIRPCLPRGYGEPTNQDIVNWAISAEMDIYKVRNTYYIV